MIMSILSSSLLLFLLLLLLIIIIIIKVAEDPLLRAPADTLEEDGLCQICTVLGTIESISDGLREAAAARF